MMTDVRNDTLPKAPKDLCFTEQDFIQDNFDVDVFLHNHRKHAKLEITRDDLGIYLKLLRSAMIDLINRDYADFVNLSSNLIGLDKAINNLQTPLGQLREEVMQVCQVLDDEIIAAASNLNNSFRIKEQKHSLRSLQHVYKSLKKLTLILSGDNSVPLSSQVNILSQAAAELNQLHYQMSRCKMDISPRQQCESTELSSMLIKRLNELFLSCLTEKDITSLIRCLRVYIMLDKASDAENVLRKSVIRPLVNTIITEENLQTDPLGLQSIYHKLLNILNQELQQLLNLTLYPNRTSIKGFNFLVNSFWVEIEEKIEQHLKSVFAPGDPELFHRRYTETLEFLSKLENQCTLACLVELKNHPQYTRFLKKWNLPVYFQIRFQEIAGSVELILADTMFSASVIGSIENLSKEDLSLRATQIAWQSLLKIWDDDVYLCQLFHRFWKLNLQVCSRYQIWCETMLGQGWPLAVETSSPGIGHATKLNFLVYLYTDVEKFVQRLSSFPEIVYSKLKQKTVKILELLKDSLCETRCNLETILPKITQEIANELLKQCVPQLKQVSDIPRLFRRTNRDVPTKPCPYVKNALNFLTAFYDDYGNVMPQNINIWLELTISSLTKHYLTSVLDVLISVQKTEESLRRLKKIRDKSTGTFPSEVQGTNDDEKIRIQLQVDVHGYTEMINSLKIPISNIQHLKELIEAVDSAVKK